MDTIEKVKKDYDLISHHFSDTRQHPWPEMMEAIELIPVGSKILDLGCGNGRLIKAIPKDKQVSYKGVDLSDGMIQEAKINHPTEDFQVENVLDISYKKEFDIILSFAVLHHLPTEKDRIIAFKRINEALKDNGLFIFTVWNMWSIKRIMLIFNSIFSNNYRFRDCLVPWNHTSGEKILRYYYAFTKKEVTTLLQKTGFSVITAINSPRNKNIFSCSNFFFVAKKK